MSDETRMLAELCRRIESPSRDVDTGKAAPVFLTDVTGLESWWKAHKSAEAKRIEDLKVSAWEKLTPEEREAIRMRKPARTKR